MRTSWRELREADRRAGTSSGSLRYATAHLRNDDCRIIVPRRNNNEVINFSHRSPRLPESSRSAAIMRATRSSALLSRRWVLAKSFALPATMQLAFFDTGGIVLGLFPRGDQLAQDAAPPDKSAPQNLSHADRRWPPGTAARTKRSIRYWISPVSRALRLLKPARHRLQEAIPAILPVPDGHPWEVVVAARIGIRRRPPRCASAGIERSVVSPIEAAGSDPRGLTRSRRSARVHDPLTAIRGKKPGEKSVPSCERARSQVISAELCGASGADQTRHLACRIAPAATRPGAALLAGPVVRGGGARSQADPQRHRRFQAADARSAARSCSEKVALTAVVCGRLRIASADRSRQHRCVRRCGRWRAPSMRCTDVARSMRSSMAATSSAYPANARR